MTKDKKIHEDQLSVLFGILSDCNDFMTTIPKLKNSDIKAGNTIMTTTAMDLHHKLEIAMGDIYNVLKSK